ncbi:hypothetical protein HYPSUDRAFT_34712 [Hypholoma sublateritium FD-334 SS-4]|uniref:Uncharacterized protein n=1 Tax=Hypholoma sublateritium (strain FD-334 SS-4) TaxID=945553 RepID=A0A0D2PGB3_HYPSF|nr:hypothetical protein HYPSUDRAFT_34712 [Hypholoma sublateritium FD-334 SS-4]
MTASTLAPMIHSSLGHPSKGLLALSPELVLEVVSHIRPAVANVHAFSTDALANDPEKPNIANLRLVCQYLNEVLEHLVLKSISFDFGGTELSEAHVESQLSLLSMGGSAVSRYATQLYIKSLCISPRRSRGYINDSEQVDAKASALIRILNVHLKNAILSLSNLRFTVFNVEQADDCNTLALNALTALPSLEKVTLNIESGPADKPPTMLLVNRFSGLRSLCISLFSRPLYYGNSPNNNTPDSDFFDQVAEVISKSPFLHHLSILQPGQCKYDSSFRHLISKVPHTLPLAHLKSLYLAITDLKLDVISIPHLRSLTSLHIEGSAHSLHTGEELWPALAAAHIKLKNITVWHLSELLAKYLESYSGLQRLHVLLIYYPDGNCTTYDRQSFLQQILPLHNLSSTIITSPADNHPPWDVHSRSDSQGLVFEVHLQGTAAQPKDLEILPSVDVTACIDCIPDCLPLVVRARLMSYFSRIICHLLHFNAVRLFNAVPNMSHEATSRQILTHQDIFRVRNGYERVHDSPERCGKPMGKGPQDN